MSHCAFLLFSITARKTYELLNGADWYPTLLKLAGANLSQPLPIDGMDVWNTLSEAWCYTSECLLLNYIFNL